MHTLNNVLSMMMILFFIMIFKLSTSYACTMEKVTEAHSRLPYSGLSLSSIHEQDLNTRQLCLLEALMLRNLEDDDIHRDLSISRVFASIVSVPVDHLQFRIIQSLIENASLSNDIHERRMIDSLLRRYRVPRLPSSFIYNTVHQRHFSLSDEKADFIDFVLERATDNNHYRESDIIYRVLEIEDISKQDIRNVKLALLTAGRDFTTENSNNTSSSLAMYGGFGRGSVVRAMIDPRATRQKKDLMALVVALEHPENTIAEGPLLRRIARTRFGSFSQEEYQCIVNALHAYLAPGSKGKSQPLTENLGYIMSNDGRCLRDSYFNRNYFTHYDINAALDEYLSILENEEEVNTPYQCVGHPCP